MRADADAFQPSQIPSASDLIRESQGRAEDYDRRMEQPRMPPVPPPPSLHSLHALQMGGPEYGLPPGALYGPLGPGPMPPWGPPHLQLGVMPPPWGGPMGMYPGHVMPHTQPSVMMLNPVAKKAGHLAVLYNLPSEIKQVDELKEHLAELDFKPFDTRRIDANGGKYVFVAVFKDEPDRNQCVVALHEAIDVFECNEKSSQPMGCIEWPCHKGDKPPSWVVHLLQFNLIYGVPLVRERKLAAEGDSAATAA
mmetsp:Transcript_58633/g.136911  ORF Transcript_58633/g.136911 Transcript_58633/m.136911 type:complete len:251 (+) Transcript_58633:56-808(+)